MVSQARRVGQTSLARSGSTSQGGKTGAIKRTGACFSRPHISMLQNWRYAAFAFLAAVGRNWIGFALSVAFRAACAFSLAANSCVTLAVIAATSTL